MRFSKHTKSDCTVYQYLVTVHPPNQEGRIMLTHVSQTLTLLTFLSVGTQVYANELRCVPELSSFAIQEFNKERAKGLVVTSPEGLQSTIGKEVAPTSIEIQPLDGKNTSTVKFHFGDYSWGLFIYETGDRNCNFMTFEQ